jgi:hypothetical protein
VIDDVSGHEYGNAMMSESANDGENRAYITI